MQASIASCYKPKPSDAIRNRALWLRLCLAGRKGKVASLLVRALFSLGLLLTLVALPAEAQRGFSATYVVLPGDTLGAIAQRHGVDVASLAAANGISNANLLQSWQELTIPGGGYSAPSGSTYTVKRGDSLDSIARLFGSTVAELRVSNNVWTRYIYPGQTLAIPSSSAAPASQPRSVAAAPARPAPRVASSPQTHVVQPGETLFRIALKYNVPLDALLRANGVTDPRRIHAGLRLRVSDLESTPASAPQTAQPAPTTPQPSRVAPPAQTSGRKRYVVRRGDSLSEIGALLGMSWRAIADINGIANPNALHAGVSLILPNLAELANYSPDNANARNFFFGAVPQPGPRVGVGRELVVDLSTQTAYAYENGVLVKRALISSGLPKTPTVQGDFQILNKVRSQTMNGPDYYLENVEWVMYFYSEYAFHGTYWHYNFGMPQSHGCVNLTNADAEWFYNFASVGTPVHVRY